MFHSLLPSDASTCPFLILAPMEGVGDVCFRKAIATIGGFDEAVRDFIRVPRNPHIKGLVTAYDSRELGRIPLVAQLMGGEPEFMAQAAYELERRGAQRIELNCGCPSNTVTGRGAGSSLLREPALLHDIARAMVQAVSIAVTVKMRSGFADTSLFKENLLAAQESGIAFLTLHPRTKEDGYGPPARWELIAEAKSLLRIPVVGNGDILTPEHAVAMLRQTGCDALMIGRGSIINPFLFREIRAHFAGEVFQPTVEALERYLRVFFASLGPATPPRTKINKLKQILGYLFKGNPHLLSLRNHMLTATESDPEAFLAQALLLLKMVIPPPISKS
jgi:tRNA-dihydrouridine synthase C